MLFNSYQFIFFFLPISVGIYYFLGKKFNANFSLYWLIFCSLLFYSFYNFDSLKILLFSIIINYLFGTLLLKSNDSKNIIFFTSIIFNIFYLVTFKYINFLIEIINSIFLSNINFQNFELPLGISFFVFTQITFLYQCYINNEKNRSFAKYILFVSFFPHLLAGPILDYSNIKNQLDNKKIYIFKPLNFYLGIFLFFVGLSKKLLIADPLSIYVDQIHSIIEQGQTIGFIESWLVSLSYTFQLYFDFSGYSDMAVGIAILFAIKIPFNFNSPYKSLNIISFWENWHMSLTNFIKIYVYNPLSLLIGRLAINYNKVVYNILLYSPFLITFFIIGLWHGANYTFIIFGLMHGFFIIINHSWRSLSQNLKISINKYLSWLVTFLSVNFSFVVFRAKNLDIAEHIYKGMLGLVQNNPFFSFQKIIPLIIICLLLVIIFPNTIKFWEMISKIKDIRIKKKLNFYIYTVIGLSFLCLLKLKTPQTFIYIQF